MLEAKNCTYRVGSKTLVDNVSIRLEPARVTAFMGPNGAGKSTLIKLLSGQLTPTTGHVTMHGFPLKSFDSMHLARRRAVLAQTRNVGFPFSVFDVVLFGRNPHKTGHFTESHHDHTIAVKSLTQTDAVHLQARIYNTLSGGEAARVDLARVLAQETDIILLDEPTNHLDPRHQVAVLQLSRILAAEGKTVVICMHDLNLCAHFCDEVVLMKEGSIQACGSPEATLTESTLEAVYDIPFMIMKQHGRPVCIVPQVALNSGPVCLDDAG